MKGACMEVELSPPSYPYGIPMSMINEALINAGASIWRKRIQTMQRDSHGGLSDECISCACIACRHYAIE